MLLTMFSVPEFAAWYTLDRRTVLRMLENGQLAGIQTPAGRWRIFDPAPGIIERIQQKHLPVFNCHLLRGVEAAELLQVSDRWIRHLARKGILPYSVRNSRRVYALADIFAVGCKMGLGKRTPGSYVRPPVVNWAKRKMAELAGH